MMMMMMMTMTGDDTDIVAEKSDFSNPDDLDKVRRYLEDTVSLLSPDADEEAKESGVQ